MKTEEYLKGLTEAALVSYENSNGRICESKNVNFGYAPNEIEINYCTELSQKWYKDNEYSTEVIKITEVDTVKAIFNDICNYLEKIDNLKI